MDFRRNVGPWKGTLVLNAVGTRPWAVSCDDTYQNLPLLHSIGPAYATKAPVTDIKISAPEGSYGRLIGNPT